MPVLVEAISVIVRRSRIDDVYPGGWSQFVDDCPNATLCADADLARVGFMAPDDVRRFCKGLELRGLVFLADQTAVDIAVVDQKTGPTTPCDWLDFGQSDDPDMRVVSCRLRGSSAAEIALPVGWRYDRSLSKESVYVPVKSVDTSLVFLRREGSTEVFLNKLTGREVYIGRTSSSPAADNPSTPSENSR